MQKSKNGPCKYDERQILARGEAYKHAILTLLIYSIAAGLADLYIDGQWADIYTVTVIGVMLTVAVFSTECIMSEAYFAVGQRAGVWIAVCAVVTVMNAYVTVDNIRSGEMMIENGMLTHRVVNPACGLVFLAVLLAVLIKSRRERAENTEQ